MADLETIVQGGAVGISIVLCGLLYKKDRDTTKLIGNHLASETKAKLKQAVGFQKLASASRATNDLIRHYFKSNGVKKKTQ